MHAQYLEMLALKVRLDYGFMMYWIRETVLHWRQNVDGASKQWLGGQRLWPASETTCDWSGSVDSDPGSCFNSRDR